MTTFFVSFQSVILVVHFIVAVLLVALIMLQSGKGTDVANVFGGAGSTAMFGPRGTATFFSKATTVLAIVFLVTSLSLATASRFIARSGGTSIIEDQLTQQPQEDQKTEEGAQAEEKTNK